MADHTLFSRVDRLREERRVRLSRSSIGDTRESLNEGPCLLTTIIQEESCESLNQNPTVLKFKNGSCYEGNISNGMLHGRGVYKWADGTIYEGEFEHNSITGIGTYHWPNGSWYEGQVLNGLRHGHGTYQCSDQKTSYTGQWVNGQRHGKGKAIYDPHGVCYYDGEWGNNVKCGMGTRQYSSGNMYSGQWKDECRHGIGTMYWRDRGEQYTGQWVDGIQNGTGEHIWITQHINNSQFPSANCYIGEVSNGLRQGDGSYYYASGGLYEGQWTNNKKNGRGKYTLPNGRVIEGIFHNDKLISQLNQPIDNGRPKTPLGSLIGDIDNEENVTEQFNFHISVLLPDTLKDTSSELKQVHYVILRYLTQLRRIYHFYSSLRPRAHVHSKLLNRMQMWQFLKDCKLYRHDLTLAQCDVIIQRAQQQSLHVSTEQFLMREFLQCLMFLTHHIYSDPNTNFSQLCSTVSGELANCLDKFMKQDCLPNACKLQGIHYSSVEITNLMESCNNFLFEIYKKVAQKQERGIPTLRQFLLFLKHYISDSLTATEMVSGLVELQPLARNKTGHEYNLELPMVYLEFLEGLLYYALSWHQAKKQEGENETAITEREAEKDTQSIKEIESEKADTDHGGKWTVVIKAFLQLFITEKLPNT